MGLTGNVTNYVPDTWRSSSYFTLHAKQCLNACYPAQWTGWSGLMIPESFLTMVNSLQELSAPVLLQTTAWITNNIGEESVGIMTTNHLRTGKGRSPELSHQIYLRQSTMSNSIFIMKQTGLMASMIILSHTCLQLLMGSYKRQSLLKKSQHAGWASMFDSSGCDNKTHA
jgi:hypothetical protein